MSDGFATSLVHVRSSPLWRLIHCDFSKIDKYAQYFQKCKSEKLLIIKPNIEMHCENRNPHLQTEQLLWKKVRYKTETSPPEETFSNLNQQMKPFGAYWDLREGRQWKHLVLKFYYISALVTMFNNAQERPWSAGTLVDRHTHRGRRAWDREGWGRTGRSRDRGRKRGEEEVDHTMLLFFLKYMCVSCTVTVLLIMHQITTIVI